MSKINGKNAVVTGGAGSLGSAICRGLLQNNIKKLAIIDIRDNDNVVGQLQKEFPKATVLFVKSSVATQHEIEEAYKVIVQNFGKIYVIVNCAGIFNEKKPQLTIDINMSGVIHSSITGIPIMSKANGGEGGYIINISSVAAVAPLIINPVYSATKAAIMSYTQAMGHDFSNEKYGIKFMAICPGATRSTLIDDLEVNLWDPDLHPIYKSIFGKLIYQEPKVVSDCVIDAINSDKNGSIWMSDSGKNKEIDVNFDFWKY